MSAQQCTDPDSSLAHDVVLITPMSVAFAGNGIFSGAVRVPGGIDAPVRVIERYASSPQQ